jgi:hypothetical protein
MAGSLVLGVEIIGEFKKLADATLGSQKSLTGLEKNAAKISRGINTALGAIGVGFSLNFLVNEFKDSTKAAIEDEKSKVLLTKALKDNLAVSDAQVDSIEQYISKTQIATSITDDQLRPAFAKLAIATKDTDKAMRLMSIATDVAAGTGKNLDAVVQAMARSLAGSDTALNRLVPSVKGAADPIAELEKLFKGAAEAAANTDPYARMNIIFGEMQEQIGMALLPYLNQLSAWLASPGGQEKIQEIVDTFVALVVEVTKIIDFTLQYKEAILAVGTAFVALTAGIKLANAAIAIYNFAMANPYFLGAALILGGIAAGMAIVYQETRRANSVLAEQNRLLQIQNALKGNGLPLPTGEQIAGATYRGIIPQLLPPQTKLPVQTPAKPGTINININRAQVDANDVAKVLNDKLKSQGSTLRIQ